MMPFARLPAVAALVAAIICMIVLDKLFGHPVASAVALSGLGLYQTHRIWRERRQDFRDWRYRVALSLTICFGLAGSVIVIGEAITRLT